MNYFISEFTVEYLTDDLGFSEESFQGYLSSVGELSGTHNRRTNDVIFTDPTVHSGIRGFRIELKEQCS